MWKSLSCSRNQLNLDVVLACGQSFRWKKKPNTNIWYGVLNSILYLLKQDDNDLYYTTYFGTGNDGDIKNYFNLDVDLIELYEDWKKRDPNCTKFHAGKFNGIRMLRQDPVENLFSFICSQNNNISRITQLVDKLCYKYGDYIGSYENEKFYSFPTVEKLSKIKVENELRKLGFGYRAKFIFRTAKKIVKDYNGKNWLYDLRERTYEEAHEGLCSLPGVGAKVADCVCLMSLDKHNAVPVDTHMWQIASRDYMPQLKNNKTLTPKLYKDIGMFFQNLYGPYAGWAHSVLFAADLKPFKEAEIPRKIQDSGKKRKSGEQKTKGKVSKIAD